MRTRAAFFFLPFLGTGDDPKAARTRYSPIVQPGLRTSHGVGEIGGKDGQTQGGCSLALVTAIAFSPFFTSLLSRDTVTKLISVLHIAAVLLKAR